MEKRSNKKKNDPKRSSFAGKKVFGTSSLQLGENDASCLVGSIIEKGISDGSPRKPISAPRPTVLPFPVARHRSHGPHWSPVGNRKGSNADNKDDEDDDEDKDLSTYDPIASFANPLQRKEKKGLDFSRWRELLNDDNLPTQRTKRQEQYGAQTRNDTDKSMPSDTSSVANNASAPIKMNVKDSCEPVPVNDASSEPLSSAVQMDLDTLAENCWLENREDPSSSGLNEKEEDSPVSSELGGEAISMSCRRNAQLENKRNMDCILPQRVKEQEMRLSAMSKVPGGSVNYSGEEGSSLECQIDAENHARLMSMSPEEIMEAQAEIMERTDPEVLKMLRNRGFEKLKKQKATGSFTKQNGNQFSMETEDDPNSKSKISHKVTAEASKDTQRVLDKCEVWSSDKPSDNLWSFWSERVEAIRELRFSLDGDVVRNGTGTANPSAHNGYNVNNVTERDFLRTEGDPHAAGYTIKEALALTRSVVPGQRALALHLLTSVLGKALHNICKSQVTATMRNVNNVDWEAVWAYALGPEPELVLSTRMSLDDNHSSVVLACAKLVQGVLSCDVNEKFFDLLEKSTNDTKGIYTAPVFRSKPEINVGFLRGGFWKYSAKPSNIVPFDENSIEDNNEKEDTIQDDVIVAGQDVAAGLVRMGVLLRIRYLLETDPSIALGDCLLSILVAIARHSPTCANAIMRCERLVQTIASRFLTKGNTEIYPFQIKSVSLMKVLACSERKNCAEFIKNGIFQNMTWHLYQYRSSLDQWVKLGKENCGLSSALMVEQLRFWKVCIEYGYGVSYFMDLFPALCLWLNPPKLEKVMESDVLSEFASISMEVYHVLEALAGRLPNFYSQQQSSSQISEHTGGDMEFWDWSQVRPMVDSALNWLALERGLYTANFFGWNDGIQNKSGRENSSLNSLLWVISAVLNMLSSVLHRLIPESTTGLDGSGGAVPWLPEYVPRIGLEIVKNGFLSFRGKNDSENLAHSTGGSPFVEKLCKMRHQSDNETSLASLCCLQGLVKIVCSIDKLIQLAKAGISCPLQGNDLSREGKILEDGILKWSLVDLETVLNTFIKIVASEWQLVQSIETFGRGGPAPGVGTGWGASGGGFWSTSVLLAQADARLLLLLHDIFPIMSVRNPASGNLTGEVRRLNSVLEICLALAPWDRSLVEKAVVILLQVPILEFLGACIKQFLYANNRIKRFRCEYEEDDYRQFSGILLAHFKKHWLSVKEPKSLEKSVSNGKKSKKRGESLATIFEDVDASNMNTEDHCCALAEEWAHQRLPLPAHWFLSPLAAICDAKQDNSCFSNILNQVQEPSEILEVAKAGLFMLLAFEAMPFLLPDDAPSPVHGIPLIWKVHSLSVILLVGMGVLEEEKSRDVYEALQEIYGQILDEAWFGQTSERVHEQAVNLSLQFDSKHFLKFQSEVHESYPTFIETLVEQFAAISYGDIIYGRQVAFYLLRGVEAPVRLATWTALSNARVLELLPPLEKCFAGAEGYLEPVEDNESILEAYVKSWTSSLLDRAAARGSVTFTLVLHHLSSFIFHLYEGDKLLLRNKLARSLLRDYSQKQQHKGMMMDLIQYKKPCRSEMSESKGVSSFHGEELEKRFDVLVEACERNSSLLSVVEKLRSNLAFTK